MQTLPEIIRERDDEITALKNVIKYQDAAMADVKKALLEISGATIPNTIEQSKIRIKSHKSIALCAWQSVRRIELELDGQGNFFCESCEKYFKGNPDYTANCWFCGSTQIFEALEE